MNDVLLHRELGTIHWVVDGRRGHLMEKKDQPVG